MTSERQTEVVKSTDSQEKPKGGRNKKQQNNNTKVSLTKFEGRCDDLKGHIYDYSESKNADQFVTTTKEIKNYVGRTYKCAGDITGAITALVVPVIAEPEEPDDPDNRIEFKKWEKEYDEYRKTKRR